MQGCGPADNLINDVANRMAPNVAFRSYLATDQRACLALFDANCPEFFAQNERTDYLSFLADSPGDYELCCVGDVVVGAFGLTGTGVRHRNLNWIMLNPSSQGVGIGAAIMERVIAKARECGVRVVNIAASHKSAAFFAKFGADAATTIENGWGPGMHRVDMTLRI